MWDLCTCTRISVIQKQLYKIVLSYNSFFHDCVRSEIPIELLARWFNLKFSLGYLLSLNCVGKANVCTFRACSVGKHTLKNFGGFNSFVIEYWNGPGLVSSFGELGRSKAIFEMLQILICRHRGLHILY